MVRFLSILFLIFFLGCISQDEKVKNIELTNNGHLKVIEDFVDFKVDTIDSDELRRSITFFEVLTGLECDTTESYFPVDEPSKKNLEDWKEWYSQNIDFLYWDNSENRIKKKSNN